MLLAKLKFSLVQHNLGLQGLQQIESSNHSIILVTLNIEFDSIDIQRWPDQMASP